MLLHNVAPNYVQPIDGMAPSLAADAQGLIIGMYGKGTAKPEMTSGPTGRPSRCPVPGELVRYQGDSHLMTFGVTGSGKTAGPVIANALDHRGPLISIECKGDVYAATAEHRWRQGHEIVLLDLTGPNPNSSSFNPIDAAEMCGVDPIITARSLASEMIPRETSEGMFWINWAETMLTGGLAYIMTQPQQSDRNFGGLFDLFHNDDVTYKLAVLLDTVGNTMNKAAYTAFSSYLQLSERETRPSVLGSTQQHLRLWEADYIRRITAETNFDLAGLIAGKPVSIYIIVPPFRMKAYAPILRLWLSSLLCALMTRGSRPQEHKTLILCDELGALGRIESFVTASTLLRSASVQLWSFWQNPAQLEIYGQDARTLVDNAGVIQLLGAKNYRMATEFSDLVGGISPDNIMSMADDEQLVLSDGGQPRTYKRVRYFDHPQLRDLVPSN